MRWPDDADVHARHGDTLVAKPIMCAWIRYRRRWPSVPSSVHFEVYYALRIVPYYDLRIVICIPIGTNVLSTISISDGISVSYSAVHLRVLHRFYTSTYYRIE